MIGSVLVRAGRVIAFGLLACAASVLLAVFAPTILGYEHLVVASGSMGRSVPVGSVAITRMVDARAVGVGDVIAFRSASASTRITHRVIEARDEQGRRVFRTKGDANATPDPEPLVTAGRVARIEWVVPYVGYAVRYARTPAGAAVLLVLPMVGLLADRAPRGARRRPSNAETHVTVPLDCSSVPRPVSVGVNEGTPAVAFAPIRGRLAG